jgi:hypothetical protein
VGYAISAKITLKRKIFQTKAHRFIWAIVTGEWPKNEIDHINGDSSDNRWENLRDITRTQNQLNQNFLYVNNTNGLMGISKTPSGKFKVQLGINGQRCRLGTFETMEEAHQVYLETKRRGLGFWLRK